MAGRGFFDVPNDILVEVIAQVKRSSTSTADLLSCALVCKKWNAEATGRLCGEIALRSVDMTEFLRAFDFEKHGSRVRCLTLKLNARLEGRLEPSELKYPSRLPGRVSQITLQMPKFRNLASFSIVQTNGVPLARSVIAQCVGALPASCVHLEVDSGNICQEKPVTGQEHLCEVIRSMLPRLRDLRVRFGNMCPLMLGQLDEQGELIPNAMPKMKNLVINCAYPQGSQMKVCGGAAASQESNSARDAWPVMTSALESVIKSQRESLADAKIYAITTTDHGKMNRGLWQCCIRADMIVKEGWVYPHRCIWFDTIPGSWLVRLHDGRELMGTLSDIDQLVEKQLWKDTIGESRLPAHILDSEATGAPSFAVGCVEAPSTMKTAEKWQSENPKKVAFHWTNERKTGTRLFEAEIRTGDKYLSTKQIQEITPKGWKRGSQSMSLEEVTE